MGQYYYPIIIDDNGKILVWMSAGNYGNGLKLMEHSYMRIKFVNTFEYGLSPKGAHYKSRVVWAGDYADPDPGQQENLHNQCDEYKQIVPEEKGEDMTFRFLVNHSKRLFVDKEKIYGQEGEALHPLPLLTVEGNGRGGGDCHSKSPLIGSWARDILSVENTAPPYTEIIFDVVK